MFNLSPIYFTCKSSNHELSKNHKISPDTKLHKTKYTKTSKKFVEELVPLVSPLLKQHIRLGHAGIVDHSSIYQYQIFKKYKKEKTESIIKNIKNIT